MEKKKEKLMELFQSNEELFNGAIEELDSWSGYLGDGRYYLMDELDEIYRDVKPTEILARAFFGYDEDAWYHDDCGNKIYGAFNPNREYFRYNGYGNLVSAYHKDYTAYLDDYFIEALIENKDNLYLDNEILEILEV